MPQFKYKAARAGGKTMEIVIEGDSQADSLSRLRQRGYMPIKFLGTSDVPAENRSSSFFGGRALDPCDFTNRLVPLLNAQIPLERSLGIIEEGMEDAKGKSIISDLRRGLHEGKKFSQLLREKSTCFPGMYANMVEAGEESGALPGVMMELQKFLNESKEMKEFLITSSIYPAIILSVASIVTILIFTVFIPKFSQIFKNLGKELPLPTQIMLDISNLINDYWWLWLILIAALLFLISQVRKGGKLRAWWDKTVIKLPVLGKLVQLIEITRFVRTLAVLLQNHVHLLDTVRIAEKVIENTYMIKTLSQVATELKGGTRLSTALGKSEFIPRTTIRMLAIGEETGSMGEMLAKVADQYETGIRSQIKRLMALFEPAVILALAGVVLMVVLSMFLAILEMNQL